MDAIPTILYSLLVALAAVPLESAHWILTLFAKTHL